MPPASGARRRAVLGWFAGDPSPQGAESDRRFELARLEPDPRDSAKPFAASEGLAFLICSPPADGAPTCKRMTSRQSSLTLLLLLPP